METLPDWFWILVYLFLLVTLGRAVFSIAKKKHTVFSVLIILCCFAVPILSFMNSTYREYDMNEFEHLLSELQNGELWSIIVIIGYILIFSWWGIFWRDKKIGDPK